MYEKLSFVDRYQRYTLMLAQNSFVLSEEMSITHAGMLTGVSTNQLLRMFDNRSIPVKNVLPRAIAIDECKGDAGRDYVDNREVLDMLPDRRVKTIKSYFKPCDTGNVKIVGMDVSRSWKKADQKQFFDCGSLSLYEAGLLGIRSSKTGSVAQMI